MSVDIVNLIESNPITKLTGNYQSKLVEKIKHNFNDYEQQIFLSSFYCYLNYNYKTDFVIDLDNVWKWLGFSSKHKTKELLEKHFINNKDYKSLLAQPGEQKKSNISPDTSGTKPDARGGHNKEIIMLNIETFKKFCLKAGTKKADEIHEYYIKMEEILQEVLQEESHELKLQLEKKTDELYKLEDNKNKEYEQKLAKEKQLERQKILLREFGAIGSLVYICKIKSHENGEYIVKIGESRVGVLARFNEHKSNYDECLLLDCFLVNRSKDFESFLHEHESIVDSRVNNLPGHENERELFLVGKKLSYQTILKIISNNLKHFNDNNCEIEKLQLEIEKLKLSAIQPIPNNSLDNSLLQQLIDSNKLILRKIDALEQSNKDILSKINSSQTKTTTGFNESLVTLGPRLQCINPETLQLVKVYESVSECMKENVAIKRPSINKAIVENTVYHGFRWMFVERNLDPTIITNLSATKPTQTQNLGYIAKLNQDKTEILNVYLDRKTAASANGYASLSALDNPVNNSTLTNGHYYALYDNCEENLKDEFVQKNDNKEPILYKSGVGQYDSNHNLIREFACKYDCIKTLHISDKTLEKALTKNVLYNEHYFKYIGAKIKCF